MRGSGHAGDPATGRRIARGPPESARQAEPESGHAPARFGPDATAGGLHQLLDDGQPDARPAACPIARFVHPIEALEQAWDVVRRDVVARIRDRDEDVPSTALRPNAHRSTR